ncbi:hypothetical protein [Aerococcus sp. 1KP-2016]|nr:hypothetical protein [Aerococcus sp. 1KP-2016]
MNSNDFENTPRDLNQKMSAAQRKEGLTIKKYPIEVGFICIY